MERKTTLRGCALSIPVVLKFTIATKGSDELFQVSAGMSISIYYLGLLLQYINSNEFKMKAIGWIVFAKHAK